MARRGNLPPAPFPRGRTNSSATLGSCMEKNSADFFLNLGFGPIGMVHAKAGGFEFARGVVKIEGGEEFLLRRHAAENLQVFRAVVFVLHEGKLLGLFGEPETKKAPRTERLSHYK